MVDPRNPDLIEHPMQSLIAQRVYALCCGYEGSSDHDRLRHDSILQTALGRGELLGSSTESMPINDCNEWISGVEAYLRGKLNASFVARFGNFSGMIFYGAGSPKAHYKNSLDGRTRQLHEFIREFAE